jgi:hypothetical protein
MLPYILSARRVAPAGLYIQTQKAASSGNNPDTPSFPIPAIHHIQGQRLSRFLDFPGRCALVLINKINERYGFFDQLSGVHHLTPIFPALPCQLIPLD